LGWYLQTIKRVAPQSVKDNSWRWKL
jgi:hypothetical protein